MLELEPARLAALVGNLLYAALGAAVLAASPRSRANRAFALFTIALGLVGAVAPLAAPPLVPPAVEQTVSGLLLIVAAAGAVALARTFPEPLGEKDRRATLGALAFGVILAALVGGWMANSAYPPENLATEVFLDAAGGVFVAASAAVAALFVIRAASSPHLVPSYASISLAIFLPTAATSGSALQPLGWAGGLSPFTAFAVLAIGVAAGGWLVVAWRHPLTKWPIAVSWIILGTALCGQLATSTPGAYSSAWTWTVAVNRLVAVGILAFMILRGQVSGLATTVRWSISRGTIAGAFVAAFFVASEAAQIAFGQENEWVGLIAAGALVFALAPLQRAAERLAERAVPGQGAVPSADTMSPPSVTSPHGPREAYRSAVRAAIADGAMTPREEEHLADVAHALGLSPRDALRIRREVEEEASA